MPVPEAFVGVPFKLSSAVMELRLNNRTIKSGAVFAFEAEDNVNVAALLKSKAVTRVDEPRGRARVAAPVEAETETQTREGG